MNNFFIGLIIFLVLNMAASLVRVVRGPTLADRLMTAQLFGSTGVAMLLLLSEVMEEPVLRNVALIFALLAVLIVVCFFQIRGGAREEGGSGDAG